MMNSIMTILFISAAVIANLLVKHFGPSALPFTAFFLIPFDMATRDYLHEKWSDKKILKMIGMVLTASAISFFISSDAKMIAIASFTAFVSSNFIDYVVYELLKKKTRLIKMNVSNAFSAMTDSVVFQLVAFYSLNYSIAFSQTSIKFIGGFCWSLLIIKSMNMLRKSK